MLNIQPTTLTGSFVQLEPLCEPHKNELYLAAQDEAIWTHSPSKAFGKQFNPWFERAIQHFQQNQHLPFAVRRLSDNKLIGSTRYYDIDQTHRRLSIGYTWYAPVMWGTSVNPECKLLLLRFAFENIQVNRVQFAIDARNTQSCAAIKKLGATQEGILRQHLILEDGFIRDTVIFSIIKSDWNQIKSALQARLDKTA